MNVIKIVHKGREGPRRKGVPSTIEITCLCPLCQELTLQTEDKVLEMICL